MYIFEFVRKIDVVLKSYFIDINDLRKKECKSNINDEFRGRVV